MATGPGPAPAGADRDAEKELDFANYFHSYGYLYHQKEMLTDHARMEAYRTAVLENKPNFEDKVVLDVGTGTGVLAIWAAKAGARRVYAVEATSMAQHARLLVEANGLAEVVTVLEGYVEKVTIPEKVDIIISEWMGYFLLRESMLDSVLSSRDKYLAPGGALYPSHAQLYMAPLCTQLYYKRQAELQDELAGWVAFAEDMRSTNQIDVSVLDPLWKREQSEYLFQSAHWAQLSQEDVIGQPFPIMDFDVHQVKLSEVTELRADFTSVASVAAELNAFGGWFDVDFAGSGSNPAVHPVGLSTAPPSDTHWGQQVFLVDPPEELLPGDTISGRVRMTRQSPNHRLLLLQVVFSIRREGEPAGEERTLNYRID